ncbi:pyridine nucleotide-disulfide oxidoreductase [Bdellovibrio bacteriovorus]|uniref:NADH:ubiquinone reductase (non-electrogenic) n=1 Tax=Bdellovibrio bacteriovorus TaxID=959 RepID=A0A150WSV8_BDEBC|nr:NAD(P)/FAD-dependent oxidoreductase [Bdellovibrio bacteriovorus]KYG67520.1 pyridine nucleotide-disulfide oxidoreductase [Bdellovibrio bacteriovorus]
MAKKVVIVGGGFAGIKAARELGNKKDVEVILIDRRNYHLFQPLLYQVATAGLSPAEISGPIRGILSRYQNISVYLDNVQGVDLANRKLKTTTKEISYDYLMLACGAKHSYFAHPEWEENAPGLKTLEQATEIRRRLLVAFERAETEANAEIQKQHLTFVIVGGGPTGVELAGAIAEISRHTLMEDFRHIDPSRTRVLLIEAGPRILAAFDPTLSRRAARDLEDLGVQIWTNTRVTDVRSNSVVLGDEVIKASTILWAAGVQPSSLNKTLGVPLDRSGRVIVEKDLSIKGHPEAFVVGDQAYFPTEDGRGLPGLGPVAMQQGLHVAKEILGEIKGQPRKEFKYFDKGQMATIGRRKAIVQIGSFKMGGFLAWLIWLFIHVYYLIGFKNKFFVIWQWAYAYLTFKRGARLIVDKEWRSQPKETQ